MKSFLRRNPVLRLLTALCCGILIQELFGPGAKFIFILFGAGALLLLFLQIIYRRIWRFKFHWNWIQGILIQGLLVAGGMLISFNHQIENKASFIGHLNLAQYNSLLVTVCSPPVEKERTIKITVKALQAMNDSTTTPTAGKIICYIRKDSLAVYPLPGEVLLLTKLPNIIPSPLNPEEFDYRQYMSRKNIHHSLFLESADYLTIRSMNATSILNFSYHLNSALQSIIDRNISQSKNNQVASAMLLGNKNFLDDEVKETFSNTGAMHILAVSGLHVGIVLMLLRFALGWMSKIKLLRSILPLLLLSGIWGYAILTGLSPSVLRSATMFSFLSLAASKGNSVSSINLLAASAFVLLCFNPQLIYDVGFQLSYAAVTGILLIYPPLAKVLHSEVYLFKKIGQITAVSIAAQVATLPISLFYFHQFPAHFLLTNLIAIPAAALILYFGFAMFALIWFPAAASVCAELLNSTLAGTLFLLQQIEHLPFSTIDNIHLHRVDLLFLVMLVVGICTFLSFKKTWALMISMLCVLGLSSNKLFNQLKQKDRSELVVYSISNLSYFEVIVNGQCYRFGDYNQDQIPYAVEGYHLAAGIEQLHPSSRKAVSKYGSLNSDQIIIEWDQFRLCWIRSNTATDQLKQIAPVDVVILSDEAKVDLRETYDILDADLLIMDSSHKPWEVKSQLESLDSSGIPYHHVRHQGAFIRSFDI